MTFAIAGAVLCAWTLLSTIGNERHRRFTDLSNRISNLQKPAS